MDLTIPAEDLALKRKAREFAENILAVLIAAADMNGVIGPPGWRVHQLRGVPEHGRLYRVEH